MKILKKIDFYTGKVLDYATMILLLVLLLLLSTNIFLRIFPIYNLSWFDEIVEFSFAWMVFLGAALLWRNKEHSKVDFLQNKLEGKISGEILDIVNEVLSLAFVILFLVFSIILLQKITAVSPILQIPRQYFYFAMPLSALIMVIYSCINLFTYVSKLIKKENKNGN